MYSQRDEAWRDKKLGASELCMNYWGCLVTAVAQALTDAGWDINPGQLCDKMNEIGGFTADGLLIWSKVEEAYPQFHFSGGGYNFIKGQWNKHQHWLLTTAEKTINPWDGSEGAPEGFVETAGGRTASIDRKEEPAPAPEPTPEPEQEQKTYTVQKGDSLSKIAKKELGDGNRWPEIYELNKDQISDPDLIYPNQELKLP